MENVRSRSAIYPGNVAAERPVVLFDDACALCASSVRFLAAHTDRGALTFLPREGSEGRRALEAHPDAASIDGIILLEGNRLAAKSDAVVRIASHLHRPWRAAAALVLVPRPLREAAYELVARNRFRWFGRRRVR